MTRWTDAPIVGGAYSDDTRPWSVQDTVNLIPVYAEREGTRSPKMLRCAPGFSDFANLGTSSPIRGMRNVEGLLLAVSGNSLFSIGPKGQIANLGNIPGVGRVSMSHNQITGGNQVAIANGTAGYVYNTVTATLAKITDEGFPGAVTFDYIDSYMTFIEPGRRFAGTSELADATSYNSLDEYEAEGSPDKLVGQIVSHREWWLFGERTIEPYVNTGGNVGSTFQRSSGTVMEVGAASPYAITKLDNSVFWLGNDGVVYRANGYSPQRISTHPIEQAISRCTANTAFAFTFEDRGHKIFYLTFQDGQTWGYDVATQEWHRRQSKGLNRWRINDLVRWNGKWIAGDFSNGKLYTLDWGVQSESGDEMERMRVTGVLADSQNAILVNGFELVFDTGETPGIAGPIVIGISGNLPDGYVELAASVQYGTIGAKLPVTFSIDSGAVPTGMSMTSTGLLSGIPTAEGSFSWRVKITDADGHVATLGDVSTIRGGLSPGLTGWRYFETTLADNTDRSAPSYDDSAWPLGGAPFGNLVNLPSAGNAAHAYDARFATTIATQVPLNQRVWIRRHLTLTSVPVNGFKLIGWFDNAYKMYINGVLAASGSTLESAGVTMNLPANLFITGDNTIAVECDDDAAEVPTDVSYFDFLLQGNP